MEADRFCISSALVVGAPPPDAAQTEGMVTAEQAKLALCCGGLLQDALHADAALHCLAVAHSCQSVMPRLALTAVLLPCLLVVGMKHVAPTYLYSARSMKADGLMYE